MIAIISARYTEREPLEEFLGRIFPGQASVKVKSALALGLSNDKLTRDQYTRGHFQCSLPRRLDTVRSVLKDGMRSHKYRARWKICSAQSFSPIMKRDEIAAGWTRSMT
jgi:hypothetical protein